MADSFAYVWPEDMEGRRLADLQRFTLSNLEYVQQEENESAMVNKKSKRPGPAKAYKRRNHWDLATTRELLKTMTEFVHSNKLWRMETSISSWMSVAAQLSNPYGLEMGPFARSCQVRYNNLIRPDKKTLYIKELEPSLEEFREACKCYRRATKPRPQA